MPHTTPLSVLRLGTRGSQLALYQARTVAQLIEDAGGPQCQLVIIKTSGDRLQEAPLSEIGGKRLFVKEIEDALLREEIDLAVHSSKDLPAVLPDGLTIAGALARADPHDAVLLPQPGLDDGLRMTVVTQMGELVKRLGERPTIGTSSVRRTAQLARLLPHATFSPIRGNLDTRLRKLDAGDYDGIVLAAAGLLRLGLGDRLTFRLPLDLCVPAPGQGIIAIEIRGNDGGARAAVDRVNDQAAEAALIAERTLVEVLGGGCQTPIGAVALPEAEHRLRLVGLVISLDGRRTVRAEQCGAAADARALGAQVAKDLLARGAGAILEETQQTQHVAIPPGTARE